MHMERARRRIAEHRERRASRRSARAQAKARRKEAWAEELRRREEFGARRDPRVDPGVEVVSIIRWVANHYSDRSSEWDDCLLFLGRHVAELEDLALLDEQLAALEPLADQGFIPNPEMLIGWVELDSADLTVRHGDYLLRLLDEGKLRSSGSVGRNSLRVLLGWSFGELDRVETTLTSRGLLELTSRGRRLTERGIGAATRVAANHG